MLTAELGPAERPRARRRPAPRSETALLQLDGPSRLLQFLLELLGLLFLEALLYRLGGLVHERLGLFQAQARCRADDLDHLDLLVSRRGQDHVQRARFFGLLAAGLACAARGSRHRGRHRGRRDAELLLQRFDALGELEHRDALQLLDPLLGACSHTRSVLLGGLLIGAGWPCLARSVRLVVISSRRFLRRALGLRRLTFRCLGGLRLLLRLCLGLLGGLRRRLAGRSLLPRLCLGLLSGLGLWL